MSSAFTTSEVAAFTGLEERRVRKDVEHGLFGAVSPPRFDFPAVVYFHTLAELGFDLGVDDRRKLYTRIHEACRIEVVSETIAWTRVTELKIGESARELKHKLETFEKWKSKLVEDEQILGGEPVFPKSRLAVRQVGGMLLNGATVEDVRDDYPYLNDQDIEYAKLYAQAYPRVGRPREAAT